MNTPTILKKIIARKHEEVAERQQKIALAEQIARAKAQTAPRGFVAAIEREPRLSRSLLRLLCLRSRNIYDLLADNALSSLRSRCARALLILIPSHGRPYEKGIEISLKLSQQEFADMVGTTRQSVNREIRRLEQDGVIRTSYLQFIVLDPTRLHQIASEAI